MASNKFLQAAMEIIYKQEYVSWSLPKGSTVVLSENPDSGEYNVNDIDVATRSRFGTIEMKFDAEIWASWATKAGIDKRCISFMLLNSDVIKTHRDVNPRSLTTFFLAVSGVKEFNSETLPFINLLATTYTSSSIAQLFTLFINNKLDRLITAKQILDTTVPFSKIEGEIKGLINDKSGYRSDIAYVITQSIVNHALHTMEDSEFKDKKLVKRFEELMTTDVMGEDLRYVLVKKVIGNKSQLKSLYQVEAIVNTVLD